jgi:hypothetical protein
MTVPTPFFFSPSSVICAETFRLISARSAAALWKSAGTASLTFCNNFMPFLCQVNATAF